MNSIHIPSLDEIRDTVKQVVQEQMLDPEGRITLFNKKRTAKLLGVCESTVDNLRVRGKLDATYLGSKPLFKYKDILSLIEAPDSKTI